MADKNLQPLEALLPTGCSRHEHAERLQRIKNRIAGHDLRKRQYVQDGLMSRLAVIVEELGTENQTEGSYVANSEEIWVQAANITCVVANGGPKFVQSILNSTLLLSLVRHISDGLHNKQTLVILHALNAIADNLPLSAPDAWNVDRRLSELLYEPTTGVQFQQLLLPDRSNAFSDRIFVATAALICKTCTSRRQRRAMLAQNVMAVLCRRLATFVAIQGLVVPSQHCNPSDIVLLSQPMSLKLLSPTIETIAVLVENSKEYCHDFLADESIRQVFPYNQDSTAVPDNQEYFLMEQDMLVSKAPLDIFLPSVPNSNTEDPAETSSFPPLGTPTTTTRKRQTALRPTTSQTTPLTTETVSAGRQEYLVIPWLLYLARTYCGKLRLLSCRLLAILLSHGLVTSSRARTFGTLLIPILIRMLDDQNSSIEATPLLLTGLHFSRAVPAVLASLIQDDSEMQRIAFEAKAIPKLATALRSTFEQVENQQIDLWTPEKTPHINSISTGNSNCGGPLLEARHIMLFREGLLRALAAIAPSDDTYRKEICDQGALVQIMLALEPFQYQLSNHLLRESPAPSSGNSTSTLLAACNAVRALTRSVTALRTKLVDADVGKAIMRLMYNSDPEVRIAATRVIANLAMDFSPLKATISEPDLVKKLCEQAHSANARLRLESIWALKSLVLNAPNKLKKDVIDELGPNWMKHLIETDPYDIPPGIVIGLSEREYPPRTGFDLESYSDDVVMDEEVDTDMLATGVAAEPQDLADQYDKHTTEDDLAIQEQLIDLIRNLFCGETASEIVEYLVGEVGGEIFIKILVDRLKPRMIASNKVTGSKSSVSRGMIIKVLYVVMHIAACAPKFRNMISQHSALMRAIAGFCNHEDPEIRAQCCWVIINLTYEDDASDREACRTRAMEIQKAGFQGLMRRLENDPEPNVRERAKTAVHLLLKMM